MRARLHVLTVGLAALLLAAFLWHKWKQDAPRRNSFQALQTLCQAMTSNDAPSLLEVIVIPLAVQSRTSAEQAEFLAKALHNEISVAGLAVLKKQGAFGPLEELFPHEADAWAKQAGVKPEDCVAFKAEHHGLRTEVVLVNESVNQNRASGGQDRFRIVRCNNVKQLANAKL